MGGKCCYSSRLGLNRLDNLENLITFLSEQIKRILFITEEYARYNKTGKTNLNHFRYFVKLESTLINLKVILEDYRTAQQEQKYISEHVNDDEDKTMELIKKGIHRKIEKLDPF